MDESPHFNFLFPYEFQTLIALYEFLHAGPDTGMLSAMNGTFFSSKITSGASTTLSQQLPSGGVGLTIIHTHKWVEQNHAIRTYHILI